MAKRWVFRRPPRRARFLAGFTVTAQDATPEVAWFLDQRPRRRPQPPHAQRAVRADAPPGPAPTPAPAAPSRRVVEHHKFRPPPRPIIRREFPQPFTPAPTPAMAILPRRIYIHQAFRPPPPPLLRRPMEPSQIPFVPPIAQLFVLVT